MSDSTENRRVSFIQGLWIGIVSIIGIVALIAMILCALNPVIDPTTFAWTSFFGLAFWPILFTNIFVFIVLLFLRARKALIVPLIAIIIAIPGFMKSYSFIRHETVEGDLKLMSYNIAKFIDTKDLTRKKAETINDYIALINRYSPDIVGLQESGRWNDENAQDFASKINMPYYFYCRQKYTGNIVFSKYPLKEVNFAQELNKNYPLGFALQVDVAENISLYIECVHLTSFSITKDEIDYVNDTKNIVEDSDLYGKSLIKKLKIGFEKRAGDAQIILENLPQDDMPYILFGDFNDTPMSYTYQQMKSTKLRDSFLDCGRGIGVTYSGRLPLLRIDYMWHNSKIVPMSFERIDEKLSDHYPILMSFNIID